MGDRPHDPVPIGRVLDGQTKRMGMGGAKEVGALFSSWERIVGPAVAAHVEPISLRSGVLKLRADSPTWATEIGYLRDDIRAQANETLGGDLIVKIEVTAGPRKRPSSEPRGAERASEGAGSGASERPVERPSRDDPMTALARAREAWLKRRGHRR